MRDDETFRSTSGGLQTKGSLFSRLNEQGKRLADVKVNVVTVVIFIACLAVLTASATGISYMVHYALRH